MDLCRALITREGIQALGQVRRCEVPKVPMQRARSSLWFWDMAPYLLQCIHREVFSLVL